MRQRDYQDLPEKRVEQWLQLMKLLAQQNISKFCYYFLECEKGTYLLNCIFKGTLQQIPKHEQQRGVIFGIFLDMLECSIDFRRTCINENLLEVCMTALQLTTSNHDTDIVYILRSLLQNSPEHQVYYRFNKVR